MKTIHETIEELFRENVTMEMACAEYEKRFVSILLDVIKRKFSPTALAVEADDLRFLLMCAESSYLDMCDVDRLNAIAAKYSEVEG